MCTVLLPPGVNPIAVNKYLYIKIFFNVILSLPPPTNCHENVRLRLFSPVLCLSLPSAQCVAGVTLVLLVTSAGRHNKHGHSRPLIKAKGMPSARTRAVAAHLSRSVMQSHSRVTRVTVNQAISGEHYLIGNRTVDGGRTVVRR
jgi:hypothetical protein